MLQCISGESSLQCALDTTYPTEPVPNLSDHLFRQDETPGIPIRVLCLIRKLIQSLALADSSREKLGTTTR